MMNSIKQNILEITKKIKSLDRFLIIDLETDRFYTSRNLDNIQLKELQKPIIAEIKTNNDIEFINRLASSKLWEKYRIKVDGVHKPEIGMVLLIDPNLLEIFVYREDEIITSEVDLVNIDYIVSMLMNCYILDMSKTNRETVDWFLGFMSSNNGYTISRSDGQYGSQLIIDKVNKIIRPVNNNLTERDKLLLEIKDFKSLFDGFIVS